jgi:hypothetical protein
VRDQYSLSLLGSTDTGIQQGSSPIAAPEPLRCAALREDGAQCVDEQGHYGTHIWPSYDLQILRVGDTMRISVELIREPNERTPLVRVREIRTEPDGSKLLVMERA